MTSDKNLREITMGSISGDDHNHIKFTKFSLFEDFDDGINQKLFNQDIQDPRIDSNDSDLDQELFNDDGQDSDSDLRSDQKSNISRLYLEDNNTTDEDNSCSSTKDTQQIDPKDFYMLIVSESDKKTVAEFNCDMCNLVFNTIEEANEHFTTHEEGTCKKCNICNNIMKTTMYEVHMNLHRAAFKERKLKNKAECKVCGKMISKSYLKFHMKMHGSNKDKRETVKHCPICNKDVGCRYFKVHMKQIHGKSEENTDIGIERTKKCPICDRLFKEHIFEKHVASHGNNKKQYVCDQCGKVFNCSGFQTHSLIHRGELKYKCEFCPYRGLHLGLLKVHVRTHTKDYLYECSICSKKFLTKSNLSMHEKRHTAIASFVCSLCKKGFYTKSKLDKHFNVKHIRIRNEKCEICNKTFCDRDGLMSHKNKIHNIKRSSRTGRIPTYLKAQIKENTTVEDDFTQDNY